ncbi:hypothetical protein EKO23_07540 [Nocardioides guangzhouensis]|uniref:DUF6318 domain-containing protein n=1 Tax=Nocardioides guangzhouensis TaxID=2497878 RepID=A0A4Q4ZH56_9ACTN|nr:DUF6318 family protein [Nocardioides guangzhouensis]RYP86821.1 hypothetical protein EKO23_07540 [Nocardioides guangzhouensis]
MNVRRWLAAACCVPLFGLAGCSDDEPQAQPKDPVSTSSTPSTEPPRQSAEFTRSAAKLFVAHWINTFNSAVLSGETSALAGLGDPGCDACGDLVDTIDDIYAAGGHVESAGWRADRYSDTALTEPSDASVRVLMKLSPQTIYRSKNGKPDKTTGGEGTAVFSLHWSDGTWQVTDLKQAPA